MRGMTLFGWKCAGNLDACRDREREIRHCSWLSCVITALVILLTGSSAHSQLNPVSVELSSLDGTTGFAVNGRNSGDFAGASVSNVGDVNVDGIDDFLIGASRGGPSEFVLPGEAYLVFGGASVALGGTFEATSLDGTNGFLIRGLDADDFAGAGVNGAGDVNADGVQDFVISAILADPNGLSDAGEVYVVFGTAGIGTGGLLNLSTLDGTNGYVINGIAASDRMGRGVGVGDVNGDGIDDLLMSASGASPGGVFQAGESYIVFGGALVGSGGVIELSSLNGTNGFVLNGISTNDLSGGAVSGAGDLNDDGFDDFVIGATGAAPNGGNSGEAYVVFGGAAVGAGGSFNFSALDGSSGFVVNGMNAGDSSGSSVSGAGDVNDDGVADLIIGARGGDPNGVSDAGESYVLFGGAGLGAGGALDLSSLSGPNGFVINGIASGDRLGSSVTGGGDYNGDGVADLLVGAGMASPNGNASAGQIYLIFGGASVGSSGSIEVELLNGFDGLALSGISGFDEAGGLSDSLSHAGDINADGIDDFLIGAPFADPGGVLDAGQTYVVLGRELIYNWTAISGGAFGNSLNWELGQIPPAGANASLRPDFGGVMTAPAGFSSFGDLTIGADVAGTAVLEVPPTALTIVERQLNVLSTGAIVGPGSLVVQSATMLNAGRLGESGGSLDLIMPNASANLDNSGVLVGSLTVDAFRTNNLAGGAMRVDAGDRMELTRAGHDLTNLGSILLFGGRLDVAGEITNSDPSGMISGNGMIAANFLTNETNTFLAFDADSSILGGVENAGGSIAILGASRLTFFNDLSQDGTMQVGTGSSAIVFGDFSGTGGTIGAGTLEVAGTFNPGASPASVSFGGDVDLTGASSTLLEFAGDQIGEFDQVLAAGNAELGGPLDLDLLGGYVPPNGASFVVMRAANVLGEFDGVANGDLVENVGGSEFYIYYGSEIVGLTVPEPSLVTMLGIGCVGLLGAGRRSRRIAEAA